MTSRSPKPVAIACPRCGLKMRVFSGAGPKVVCPSCGKTLRIVRPPGNRLAAATKSQDPPMIGHGLETMPERAAADKWYYRILGVEVGPLSFESLRQHFRARKLGPDAQVRMGSKGKWVLAETVPDLHIDGGR